MKMNLVFPALFAILSLTQAADDCGKTPINPVSSRIVGGQSALPYSWPWQVALCYKNGLTPCTLICGGSIVGNEWILTAAHCVARLSRSDYKNYAIKVGAYDYENNDEEGEQVVDISQVFVHPLYGYTPYAWDTALIKLSSPVNYTDHIQPVCVPANDSAVEPGNTVYITGWGATEEGGWTSTKLMQVEVPIINEKLCDSAYNGLIHSDTMFCAGVGGKDSCQGDSGGPVVRRDEENERWVQYGIVSWGYGCAREGFPVSLSQAADDCGKTPINPVSSRIVGGQSALPYSWPWQVALCYKNGLTPCTLICGGSIVGNEWILTAAHCVARLSQSDYKNYAIKVGAYDYENNDEEGEQVVDISQVFVHPLYGYTPYAWDTALIKLSSPVNYTDHIQPVCVPANDSAVEPGNTVYITGWGATEEGGWTSNKLMQVEVPIINEKLCDSAYNGLIHSDTMFCAGVGGKDSCQGDSGGPVVRRDEENQRWIQYGIVSWGYGCAREGFPGVYARVRDFCDWFRQILGFDICI